jgi:hypothetical protein
VTFWFKSIPSPVNTSANLKSAKEHPNCGGGSREGEKAEERFVVHQHFVELCRLFEFLFKK